MALWQLMMGLGLGLIATIITIAANRAIESGPHRQKHRSPEYVSSPNALCSICLEKLSTSDIQYLSCGHAFHDGCFKQLKKNCRNCPECRAEIRPR